MLCCNISSSISDTITFTYISDTDVCEPAKMERLQDGLKHCLWAFYTDGDGILDRCKTHHSICNADTIFLEKCVEACRFDCQDDGHLLCFQCDCVGSNLSQPSQQQ